MLREVIVFVGHHDNKKNISSSRTASLSDRDRVECHFQPLEPNRWNNLGEPNTAY